MRKVSSSSVCPQTAAQCLSAQGAKIPFAKSEYADIPGEFPESYDEGDCWGSQ